MREPLGFFDPVTKLRGVGANRARELAAAGLGTVEDLLEFLPRRYIDRSRVTTIGEAKEGETVTIVAAVRAVEAATLPRRRVPVVHATLFDGTGYLTATWYGRRFLARTMKDAERVAVSGRVKRVRGRLVVENPDFDLLSEEDARGINTGAIVPVYPSAGSVGTYGLRRLVRQALDRLSFVFDPLPIEVVGARRLLARDAAFREAHFPSSFEALEEARNRFLYEELFTLQAGIAEYRVRYQRSGDGYAHRGSREPVAAFLAALGIELTASQARALEEIVADLASDTPMNRLLEGDVGSGKTAVALAAAAYAARAGGQVAYMAPTEILAEQQYARYGRALAAAGVSCALLTGSTPARERQRVLAAVEDGAVALVFGTHALIYDDVRFHRLTFAIIDEQHRFGTEQRQALAAKGSAPDVLVMTATPIPRTLALTVFGDLDMSVIEGRPHDEGVGAKVATTVLRESGRRRAYDHLAKEVARGRQGFVVVPLVERSANIEAKALAHALDAVRARLGEGVTVAVVHGRQRPEEKRAAMEAFVSGAAPVLVSTTVVEVGIDVPNATVMIVENAERFGLAQLHQLRGRVGRGSEGGRMFAVCGNESEGALERLRAFVRSRDGFELAEQDLLLRGEGDILGARQSGASSLRLARFARHRELVEMARADAFAFVEAAAARPATMAAVRREIRKRYNQLEMVFVS